MNHQLKEVSTDSLVSLAECPIGLFLSAAGELCLKTEYGADDGRIDAYIVSSGEFFWGGARTPKDQRAVLVTPTCIDVATRRLREALKLAVNHIEHMAAWIAGQNAGYSFEALGEDSSTIRDALNAGEGPEPSPLAAIEPSSPSVTGRSQPAPEIANEAVLEQLCRIICKARELSPDCLHQNYDSSEPVDAFISDGYGRKIIPAHKGWRNQTGLATTIMAEWPALTEARAEIERLNETIRVLKVEHEREASQLVAEAEGWQTERNMARDAEEAAKSAMERWKGSYATAERYLSESDKELSATRTLLTETVERCAKVAESCLVKFSVCKSGILQDQIDIARKDIAAAIRATLSKIKAEAK